MNGKQFLTLRSNAGAHSGSHRPVLLYETWCTCLRNCRHHITVSLLRRSVKMLALLRDDAQLNVCVRRRRCTHRILFMLPHVDYLSNCSACLHPEFWQRFPKILSWKVSSWGRRVLAFLSLGTILRFKMEVWLSLSPSSLSRSCSACWRPFTWQPSSNMWWWKWNVKNMIIWNVADIYWCMILLIVICGQLELQSGSCSVY